MIERVAATEDEMLAAFLMAEIDSSRYGPNIRANLAARRLERRLIDAPNMTDSVENATRRQLIGNRGYENREALFAAFPRDVTWRRVELEAPDFDTMRYINDTKAGSYWANLSDGTRLVSAGARNLRQRPADPDTQQIGAIAQALRKGVRFPATNRSATPRGFFDLLIEGHSRATAYVMEHFAGVVEAFVGSSPSMPSWVFTNSSFPSVPRDSMAAPCSALHPSPRTISLNTCPRCS